MEQKGVNEFTAVPEEIEIACSTALGCDCCCDKNQSIVFNPCEDVKDFTVQNVMLNCEGRFLKVRVQLKNVCRGRNIRLGVLLCEKRENTSFIKGMRVCEFTVPGSVGGCLDNITVGDFCFVIPEDNLCCPREVNVHVVAHYSSFPSFSFCPCP